jgi:hypothetical protein
MKTTKPVLSTTKWRRYILPSVQALLTAKAWVIIEEANVAVEVSILAAKANVCVWPRDNPALMDSSSIVLCSSKSGLSREHRRTLKGSGFNPDLINNRNCLVSAADANGDDKALQVTVSAPVGKWINVDDLMFDADTVLDQLAKRGIRCEGSPREAYQKWFDRQKFIMSTGASNAVRYLTSQGIPYGEAAVIVDDVHFELRHGSRHARVLALSI